MGTPLLVGGSSWSPRARVAFLLGATAILCLPSAGWYVAVRLGRADPPSGSTYLGLGLGVVAALIILFEMLLWPRKRLRRYRLGKTRAWMYWHIWLGLLSLPLAVGHAGFQFGGPLTTVTLVLFLAVIASGIWGLTVQQVIPTRLLIDFPAETVESEVDRVMAHHVKETASLVDANTRPGDPLRDFFSAEVAPYLSAGPASGSPLRSAARADTVFNDYQARQPAGGGLLQKMRSLCDARRQYDQQVRLHRWLHNWQLVHVPLSVALCVVLAAHIVSALKYW